MDMTGEYRIPAPRQTVWAALNDPETLRQCLPGCEELLMQSPTEMTARVHTRIGPVSARFSGKVTLSELNPPESYRISGEGSGGVAGFAKGGATVHLAEDGPGTTILTYQAQANVGGKLAQIGARLIDGTARKLADEFFSRFAERVGSAAAVPTPAATEAAPPMPPPISPPKPLPPVHVLPPEPPETLVPPPPPPPPVDDSRRIDTAPPQPAAAVEPDVPFPPAQPDLEAAAVASTQRPAAMDRMPPPATPVTPPPSGGLSPIVWIAGLVVIVAVLLLIFTGGI